MHTVLTQTIRFDSSHVLIHVILLIHFQSNCPHPLLLRLRRLLISSNCLNNYGFLIYDVPWNIRGFVPYCPVGLNFPSVICNLSGSQTQIVFEMNRSYLRHIRLSGHCMLMHFRIYWFDTRGSIAVPIGLNRILLHYVVVLTSRGTHSGPHNEGWTAFFCIMTAHFFVVPTHTHNYFDVGCVLLLAVMRCRRSDSTISP